MLVARLKFIETMLKGADQLVALRRAALQRVNPLQQLFHRGFLLLHRRRLCMG